MIIYPDIEIKDGKTVNLTRGLEDSPRIFDVSPLDLAKQFEASGAEWLHVIDIDGVFQGGRHNADIICEIIKNVNIPVQVGGGVRTTNHVEWWLEQGAERVVLGTAAVVDQHFVWEACSHYPNKIVVAVDSKDGFAMIDGWRTQTTFKALDIAKQFEDTGVAAIIYTDINRFEQDPESNLAATTEMGSSLSIPVISTGTVSGLDDISNLRLLPNISGAIIGKALLEGTFTMEQALEVANAPGVDASLAQQGVAPAEETIQPVNFKQVSRITLPCASLANSTSFYEKIGFVKADRSDSTCLLDHPSGLKLELKKSDVEVVNNTEIHLKVNSLENTIDRLEQADVPFVKMGSVDTTVSVSDPDQHQIIFVQ